MSDWGEIMKSEVPPLLIGSASLDVTTVTAIGLVLLIGMAVVVGIRKDVAAFALIAGTLTIALTM